MSSFLVLTADDEGIIYAVNASGDLEWYRDKARDGVSSSNSWVNGQGQKIEAGWGEFTHIVLRRKRRHLCGRPRWGPPLLPGQGPRRHRGLGLRRGQPSRSGPAGAVSQHTHRRGRLRNPLRGQCRREPALLPGQGPRWHRGLGLRQGPASEIGTGWDGFQHIVGGGCGILYAVNADGNLLYFRDRARDGTEDWAYGGAGQQIGTGWGRFASILGGGCGTIYATTPDQLSEDPFGAPTTCTTTETKPKMVPKTGLIRARANRSARAGRRPLAQKVQDEAADSGGLPHRRHRVAPLVPDPPRDRIRPRRPVGHCAGPQRPPHRPVHHRLRQRDLVDMVGAQSALNPLGQSLCWNKLLRTVRGGPYGIYFSGGKGNSTEGYLFPHHSWPSSRCRVSAICTHQPFPLRRNSCPSIHIAFITLPDPFGDIAVGSDLMGIVWRNHLSPPATTSKGSSNWL